MRNIDNWLSVSIQKGALKFKVWIQFSKFLNEIRFPWKFFTQIVEILVEIVSIRRYLYEAMSKKNCKIILIVSNIFIINNDKDYLHAKKSSVTYSRVDFEWRLLEIIAMTLLISYSQLNILQSSGIVIGFCNFLWLENVL